MSLQEIQIVEAAIQVMPTWTEQELISAVADATEIPVDDVKVVLVRLRNEGILKLCGTPPRDVDAGEPARISAPLLWYEKGVEGIAQA